MEGMPFRGDFDRAGTEEPLAQNYHPGIEQDCRKQRRPAAVFRSAYQLDGQIDDIEKTGGVKQPEKRKSKAKQQVKPSS